jgi:PBP1b-binding outer membrane lipoprotein LpoB
MPRFWILSILISVSLLTSCSTVTSQGKTRVIDVSSDDELGGTGTESGDIRTVAERMSREITGINWPRQGEMPRIAVLPIINQTRFRIDPKLLQNKLVKDLVNSARSQVQFLARDTEADVIGEREKKRAGLYDSGKTSRAMFGADYLLKGEMRALSKSSRDGVSDYIHYSFQLIDAETAAILWMGDYETKKVGSVGVIYQ